jgi:hypothetical protein
VCVCVCEVAFIVEWVVVPWGRACWRMFRSTNTQTLPHTKKWKGLLRHFNERGWLCAAATSSPLLKGKTMEAEVKETRMLRNILPRQALWGSRRHRARCLRAVETLRVGENAAAAPLMHLHPCREAFITGGHARNQGNATEASSHPTQHMAPQVATCKPCLNIWQCASCLTKSDSTIPRRNHPHDQPRKANNQCKVASVKNGRIKLKSKSIWLLRK